MAFSATEMRIEIQLVERAVTIWWFLPGKSMLFDRQVHEFVKCPSTDDALLIRHRARLGP